MGVGDCTGAGTGIGAGVGGVIERADSGEGAGTALMGLACDILLLLDIGGEVTLDAGVGGGACVPFSRLM